jgi:DNA-3-methyladenine glycosylase
MRQVLTESFFARSAPVVAKDLLGKYLVRNTKKGEVAYMITETEGYHGLEDLASHASKGKTQRTEVMFGNPGVFYIPLIYGMYYMLNVVTGKFGHPSGVLIRGLHNLNGPGRLTRELQITKELNLKKSAKATGLWFEDRGVVVKKKDIVNTARIGVEYAGPLWSKKLWRFVLQPKP